MIMDNTSTKDHSIPLKYYLMVTAALIVLTAVTVGVSYINLGGFNVVVALAVASSKSILVAFIFMHLLFDKKINLLIFAAALVFLTVFLVFTLFDTMNRGEINIETRDPINKPAEIYEQQKDTPVTLEDGH
jgi:cytochrome c oxidase subunit 4